MSMGDDRNSSPKPVKACDKILSAVTSSSVYRTLRRISSRQEHPRAASPAPNPSQLIHTPLTVATTFDIPITTPSCHEHDPKSSKTSQHLDAGEVIPIEFDFSSPHKLNVEALPATPSLPILSNNPGLEPPAKQVHKEAKQPEAADDKDLFSNFITLTRMKMLNGEDDAEDKKKKERDTDQEYIDRTKMKIRTTTSMKDGK